MRGEMEQLASRKIVEIKVENFGESERGAVAVELPPKRLETIGGQGA